VSAVVDASVLVAAAVDTGPEGLWAERIVADQPLAAPALVLAEAMNILRRLELSEKISRLEATAAHEDLLRLDIELFPIEPVAARVWQLRHNLTCYDAWYVAIAETLGLPLATLDDRLRRAPGPTCRFLIPA
jgi:predicted nucleic acid-binding protein